MTDLERLAELAAESDTVGWYHEDALRAGVTAGRPLFWPAVRNAADMPHPGRGRLAEIRADGLRLLTWAPRRPEVLPDAVRREVARWEAVERRAREAEPTDLVALITADQRLRHLLREG